MEFRDISTVLNARFIRWRQRANIVAAKLSAMVSKRETTFTVVLTARMKKV